MSRVATTTDVFNAIAELRRREMIGLLHDGRESDEQKKGEDGYDR